MEKESSISKPVVLVKLCAESASRLLTCDLMPRCLYKMCESSFCFSCSQCSQMYKVDSEKNICSWNEVEGIKCLDLKCVAAYPGHPDYLDLEREDSNDSDRRFILELGDVQPYCTDAEMSDSDDQ